MDELKHVINIVSWVMFILIIITNKINNTVIDLENIYSLLIVGIILLATNKFRKIK